MRVRPALIRTAVVAGALVCLLGATAVARGWGGWDPFGARFSGTVIAFRSPPQNMQPDYPGHEYVAAPAAQALDGLDGTVYRFEPDASSPSALMTRVSAELGVIGTPEPVTQAYLAPGLRISGGSLARYPAMRVDLAVVPNGVRAFSYTATDEAPQACSGAGCSVRYDEASAVRDARARAARLGAGAEVVWSTGDAAPNSTSPQVYSTSPQVDGTSREVTTVHGRLAGVDLWRFAYSGTGRLVAATGPLAPVRSLGLYPTVSAGDGVNRLGERWLPRVYTSVADGLYDCTQEAFVRLEARPVSQPLPLQASGLAYSPVPGGSPYNPPTGAGNPPSPVVTRLVSVVAGSAIVNDARCTSYVAPVLTFTDQRGNPVPVLALADAAIDLTDRFANLPPATYSVPASPLPGQANASQPAPTYDNEHRHLVQ